MSPHIKGNKKSPGHPLPDSPFMKACRMEPAPFTPVWLMRQAGRYMKEYREMRAKHPFAEMCRRPELATEAAVVAARKLQVDAAILFSDLLVVCAPMGFPVRYLEGRGPVITRPLQKPSEVSRVRTHPQKGEFDYIYKAVRMTRAGLPGNIPLIGFAGAPFTLASYLIEGGGSRNYVRTKAFMYADPGAWDELMKKITSVVAPFLRGQAAAGAQVLQVFDSWAGCLSPDDYRRFVLPHTARLIRALGNSVPVIHFGTGSAHLIELLEEAGGDVIGVDWKLRLDGARKRLGRVAVQGNLDPVALFAPRREMRGFAREVLQQAGHQPGHIFNLGHGILPRTPEDNVRALIDAVHELSAKR